LSQQATATRSGASEAAAADVELESLVKSFGDVRAVDGVDLAIRRGEFFTMLGPSGSGKTTTSREDPHDLPVRFGRCARSDRCDLPVRFTVWVNEHLFPLASEMPHGGFKRSGYGKDMSLYSMEEYTRIKHVAVKLA
jgi:hypothetical protein